MHSWGRAAHVIAAAKDPMSPFDRSKLPKRFAPGGPAAAGRLRALLLVTVVSGLLGDVGAGRAESVAQDPSAARPKRFEIKRYARMPGDTGLAEARQAAEQMFPAGSSAVAAENILKASGATCNPGADNLGPYIFCSFRTRQILLVSTDWRVILRTNEERQVIQRVFVGRDYTGP